MLTNTTFDFNNVLVNDEMNLEMYGKKYLHFQNITLFLFSIKENK